jgi:hypothetical protein
MILNKVESSGVFSPEDPEKIRSQMLSEIAGTLKAPSLEMHHTQLPGAALGHHAPASHPDISRPTRQTLDALWKMVDAWPLLDPIPGDTEPLAAAERHWLLLDIHDLPQ